jgi:glutamyl-tRNA synthetase
MVYSEEDTELIRQQIKNGLRLIDEEVKRRGSYSIDPRIFAKMAGKNMVRTRFAPSPTGMLHIGGVRTALYNYLFAKRYGGEFLLRIEDTDRKRNTPEALTAILDGLAWAGLKHDGEIVFQSERAARHTEVAEYLLAIGKAYKCFCTADDLKAAHDHAIKNHLRQGYNRACRKCPPEDVGQPYCVRLLCPVDGETVVDDLVQGTVRVNNAELDDMIILRADGTPTYLLAVVVDDHDMDITHVIRGDDHLTNTFRQVQIYNALGWAVPQFAHIPLIHSPDGKKLTKRDLAVGQMSTVEELRDEGYLPEAAINYLLRLGWGRSDIELISVDEAIKIFDLADVGRAAARMDYKKLLHTNGVYMRQADDARLIRLVQDHSIQDCSFTRERRDYERLTRAMPALKERAKTIVELRQNAKFLMSDEQLPFMALSKNEWDILDKVRVSLALTSDFYTQESAQEWFTSFCEKSGIGMGPVAKVMRIALTGSKTSPPMDSILFSLGIVESTRRIARVLVISYGEAHDVVD